MRPSTIAFVALCLHVLAVQAQDADFGSGDERPPDKDKDAPIECQVIEIENGVATADGKDVRSQNSVRAGSTVQYECIEGYRLVGPGTLQCIRATERFDLAPPRCEPIMCPDPGVPVNGGRTGNDFTYSRTVTFTCRTGYSLVGSVRRTCRSDGSWSGSPVRCTPVDCGDPGAPDNGARTLNPNTLYPSTVSFTCDRGFDILGARNAVCQPDGTWSEPTPACRVAQCCELEAPRNGAKTGEGTTYNDVAMFTCDDGFELVGPMSRTCKADGAWTGDPVRCEPIMCPVPVTIDNGGYRATTLNAGSTATFYCDTGYHLSGDEVLTCLPTGKWDKPLPECIVVDCGNPGMPENGARDGGNFEFRMSVGFRCNPNYRLVGSVTRFCQADGTWTGSPPMCNLIVCGDPGTPANGKRVLSGVAVDGTVSWSCNDGYRMIGTGNAVCRPSGTWSAPTPICERVLCVDPGMPAFGSRLGAQPLTLFEPQETAMFQCNIGFLLEGNREIECMMNGSWNKPVPACELLECLDPGHVENGFRELESLLLDATVKYQCNPGYTLLGSESRTCVQGPLGSDLSINPLVWDNALPSCVEIECPNPGSPANGARAGDDFTFMGVVQFTCNSGYVLLGSPAALCMADKTWSNPLPTCRPVRCPDPGQLANGARRLPGTMFMDVVVWNCDLSYVLMGSPTARCQADGTWSEPVPRCQLAECTDPGTPENGYKNLEGVTVGSMVDYGCNAGYRLVGPKQRECLPARDWSLTLPSCEVIMCPDPLSPVNGGRRGNDFSYAMSVSFFCNEGYRLMGVPAAVCLADGSWSEPTPRCQIIDCGDPGQLANGRRALTSTVYGSQVGYSCISGYVLVGSPSATCEVNGRWSEPLPQCVRRACPDPGTPAFGSRTLEGLRFDENVNWRCNVGYNLVGLPDAVCQGNGQWSNPLPTCQPIRCQDPGTPVFGARSLEGLVYQNRVDWSCDVGYIRNGQPSAICTADGTWSNPVPTCQPVDCGDPGTPINGARDMTTTTLGSKVAFSCNGGYRMDGELEAVCLPSGSWSRPPPRCIIIECPDVIAPTNGNRILSSRVVGSEATFSCNEGYILEGVPAVQCMINGQWSDPPPICQIVECHAPPPVLNGAISYTTTSFKSQARYRCDPGYSLVGATVRDCFASGIWNPAAPACVKITCGNPGTPANGQRIGDDFSYQATVSFLCDINYQLNGPISAICQQDGTWSDPLPVCDPDCTVGGWGLYGQCSVTCGDGTQQQNRAIMQAPSGLGLPCPNLERSRGCNPGPCIQCEDRYPEGAIVYRLTQVDISVSACIVIVVDESSSMETEHAWLPGLSDGLEQNLRRQGIGSPGNRPNTYSLVGYGRRSPNYYANFLTDDRGRRVFPSSSFPQAASKLYADPEGRVEDGYQAIEYALSNINCESNGSSSVAKNLIFISDEDRDVTPITGNITRSFIKRFLRSGDWLPNVVVDNTFMCNGRSSIGVDSNLTAFLDEEGGTYQVCSNARIGGGYATTRRDYTNLALELGGAAWDINVLRQGGSKAASFTNAFTDVKTREIRRATDQCRRCACDGSSGEGLFQCSNDPDQERCNCLALSGQWNAETRSCAGLPESQACIVSQWTQWSPCSRTCGVGSRSRGRQVTQRPLAGGEQCPPLSEVTTCSLVDCPRDCPHPGVPVNGASNPTSRSRSFRPTSAVDFTCNAGFRLVGEPRVLCLTSGRWSAPLPTCVALNCRPGVVNYESSSGGLAADVNFIIDQSRSMQGEIDWLPQFVSNLESSLRTKNIGSNPGCSNLYSITGYGRAVPNHLGRVFSTDVDNSNCFPSTRFNQVNSKVEADSNGRVEDGYEATKKSMDNVRCVRSSDCTVGCNVILISDEDRDVEDSSITRNSLRRQLVQRGCILNVVVDNTFTAGGTNALGVDSSRRAYIEQPGGSYRAVTDNVVLGQGYASTKSQYTDLALELGGGAWDINIFRQGGNAAASFTSGFVDFKAEEILNQLSGCQVCTCSSLGEKVCIPARDQQECSCRSSGRIWDAISKRCL